MFEDKPHVQEYFNSLPEFIKTSIVNSNMDFQSEDDIRKFVEQLENKQYGG